MNETQTIIVAHSQYQYDMCQSYLKGEVRLGVMYPLMITYYNEIMKLYNGHSINHVSDEDVAIKFCEHVKPPKT